MTSTGASQVFDTMPRQTYPPYFPPYYPPANYCPQQYPPAQHPFCYTQSLYPHSPYSQYTPTYPSTPPLPPPQEQWPQHIPNNAPQLDIQPLSLQLPAKIQDVSNVLERTPVYDVYEEDNCCPNGFINVLDATPSCSGYGSILGRPLDLDKHLAHGGGTQQVFEERSQPYGLHSLECRNVTLTDGTVHSYFALPADYPLERATPVTSLTLAEGGSVTVVNPPVAQAEGWTAPVHAASLSTTQLIIVSSSVVTSEVAGSGTRDMPITDFQEFHEGENLLLGKSDSELLHKSFNFTLADAPYFRSMYVPDVHVGKAQHLKAYKWSMLLPKEGRKDWDPGASVNLLLFTSCNQKQISFSSCNQKQISKLCSALQALMCDATATEDKQFGDPYISAENYYELQLSQTMFPLHNSRTATTAVIRSQDYSFHWEARLQWDPGANMAYFYSWLHIFSEFEKPLQLTQGTVPFALQYQLAVSSAPCFRDPGIALLSYQKRHIVPETQWAVIDPVQQQLQGKSEFFVWEFSFEKNAHMHGILARTTRSSMVRFLHYAARGSMLCTIARFFRNAMQ